MPVAETVAPRYSGALAVTEGSLPNADAVIATGQAGVRKCLDDELAKHPEAKGRLTVDVAVGSSGYVLNPSAKVEGLDKSVAGCAKKAVKDLKFEKPTGKPVANVHGVFDVPGK